MMLLYKPFSASSWVFLSKIDLLIVCIRSLNILKTSIEKKENFYKRKKTNFKNNNMSQMLSNARFCFILVALDQAILAIIIKFTK
jgi:hypothetical protein